MLRAREIVTLSLLAVTILANQSPVSAQTPAVPAELAVPDPVAVSLDANTTAFLAIDFLPSTCGQRPSCVSTTLPAVAAGLTAARANNALVVYSVHLAPDNTILGDVAPMPRDTVFSALPGDKFFDSNLDFILRQAGTTTLVLTGVTSNSGVLYTVAGAIQRGYTVVVAEDGINAATDLATSVALWQMLNGAGANSQNIPLQAKAVTLSRTNLITYN